MAIWTIHDGLRLDVPRATFGIIPEFYHCLNLQTLRAVLIMTLYIFLININ